ncbi:MAG: copper resistance protein CopC [Acetobacteraceae bacterium]|nr:copper resistance protein CopC [Acetobacteraceae bacterium]
MRQALILPLLFLPLPASAHAGLMQSTPAPGARAAPGPVPFNLRYNSRIDVRRSQLKLLGPDHKELVLPVTAGPTEDTLQTTAQLGPGNYILRWQVLATDGHITRGELRFTVTGHE